MRIALHHPRRAEYESVIAEREQLLDSANSLAATRRDPKIDRWWYAVLYTVLFSIVAAAGGAAVGTFAFASMHGMCSAATMRAGRCHRE